MRASAITILLILMLCAPGASARTRKYELRFDNHSSHSCSRSHASSSHKGVMKLTVGGGKARLSMDLDYHHVFGPSYGRWRNERKRGGAGSRPVHSSERWRYRWQGTARRTGGVLSLKLQPREIRCVLLPGGARKPLIKSCLWPAPSLTFTCRPGKRRAHAPAKKDAPLLVVAAGSRPRLVTVMLCKPTGKVPNLLEPVILDGEMVLGPRPGLVLAKRRSRMLGAAAVLRAR